MYYFLEKDLLLLDAKIMEAVERLRKAGKEMGESTEQSSETYHDNFPFEEAKRQFEMYSTQLNELRAIRAASRLVSPPDEVVSVCVGSVVCFLDLVSNEEKEVEIGSFMISENHPVNRCSYGSPLAKMLIGKKTGQEVEGDINGQHKRFKVVSVRRANMETP